MARYAVPRVKRQLRYSSGQIVRYFCLPGFTPVDPGDFKAVCLVAGSKGVWLPGTLKCIREGRCTVTW